MDLQIFIFFLFAFVVIGYGLYLKFHPEKLKLNKHSKWPQEGMRSYAIAFVLIYGILILVATVLMLLLKESDSIDLVMIPTITFFTLLSLWLSWKFIFRQVDRLRIIMLIFISLLTLAGIAFSVYYVCGYEPSAEVEVAEKSSDEFSMDLAINSFFLSLMFLVTGIRLLVCPERTKAFKNLTDEQREKADLASYQKVSVVAVAIEFAALLIFGIVACYVKMNDFCIFIPLIAMLPIEFMANRRKKVLFR